MTPEYTGPPIGEPPEHVHENEPVVDALEEQQEEVDELVAQVTALGTLNAARHTELLERIASCQTQLTNQSDFLSSQQAAESPLLTQIQSQQAQMQQDLTSLRSLLDSRLNSPNPRPSELISTEETDPRNVEDQPEAEIVIAVNPEPPRKKKTVFI